MLLVHGDRDTRVPTEQSVLFHAGRASAAWPTELLLVPGAGHGFVAAERHWLNRSWTASDGVAPLTP